MLFFTYLRKCLCTNRNLVNTIVKSYYMHIHQIIKCPIPINYNLNGESEIRTHDLLNVIQSLPQLNYTVSFIFTKFLFNRLFSHYTLCQPWKSKKNRSENCIFQPCFLLIVHSKTTTSCGSPLLFLLFTKIYHHCHCFNMCGLCEKDIS